MKPQMDGMAANLFFQLLDCCQDTDAVVKEEQVTR